MNHLHGQCQTITNPDQLNQLNISRDGCLDANLKDQVRGKVDSSKELLFLGNDVCETTKKQDYRLFIHGILPCGSKTTIAIHGIDPFVDVKCKPDETDDKAMKRIRGYGNQINSDDFSISKIVMFDGKDFMFYSHQKNRYARVYFRSLKSRQEYMNACSSLDVKTFSNDRSSYYRSIARMYEINLSGWNILTKYEIDYASNSKAKYKFIVNINDIIGIDDDKRLSEVAIDHGFSPSLVKYENMIISSFDIEMIPAKLDRFPDADKNPRDEIFMICMTYHLVKRKESLLSVVLTLKETDPLDDAFVVHCRTEKCLLKTFARFMHYMQPDFITEFNGGGFDWRNVITKTRLCYALPDFLKDMSLVKLQSWELQPSMLSRFHKPCNIKINGATADSIVKGLKMPGFIGFDTLVVFKQLEPNADSHKLNECLKRCNLGSKDDLDVKEMFRIYRQGDSKEMKLVAHYCFIDTFKLQQLLIKKNVVQDRREVANLSYTSLYDGFYFAGGSRMRNLLMNRAQKKGYVFDTHYRPDVEDPDAKFPGAHVVPPIKGIAKPVLRLDEYSEKFELNLTDDQIKDGYKYIADHFETIYHSDDTIANAPEYIKPYIEYTNVNQNHYPISGLDYASLYPSIIMTYNISPEKLIIDEQYAKQVADMGETLQHVSFPFCGKMVHAWFVRHNNVAEDYSICGQLLIELFARRAELKKVLKHYGEQIYEMEQEMKPYLEQNDTDKYPRIDEYNEAKFNYVSCDSKQKAVKVFMNTLYGEMGATMSCICAIQVAASVTTMGRHNLLLAQKFVEGELRMKTYYGDSVVGDTPIMIKRMRNGVETKDLIPIEELDNRYELYNGGKECIDYSNENVYVMTESGYSKIMKVIRHRTNKKLYRVTTHIGSVIVTEDHSLLDSKKQKIKPQDCKEGTELLHWELPEVVATSPIYYGVMHAKSQLEAQELFLSFTEQGYHVSIDIVKDTYRLTFSIEQTCKCPTAIKSIELMGECDGYVYDLETESHHFAAGVGRMVVHNTDSLYVSCNKSHFIEYDRSYFTGQIDKLEYGTKLVEETFNQIEIAKTLVNEMLIKDNGSKHLKMAYEEVLYPVAFLSKKKYYGVPHEENVDFYPKNLFLRGLEIVKRGSSDVLKDVVNGVIREVMDLKTTDDIIDIIKKAVERFFTIDWPVDAFAKAKVYRPDKKNIAVTTLINRYRAMNYPTIPEPNVRFKTVICKYYPWSYDIQGKIKTKMSIGDKMELVERVQSEGLEIDLEYYFDNELTGQFARLITFCDEFADSIPDQEVVDTSKMTSIELDAYKKEIYQRSEDALFKAAKKFIGQLAKHYSKAYVNKGSLFVNTWREVNSYVNDHLELCPFSPLMITAMSMFDGSDGNLRKDLFTWAEKFILRKYKIALTPAKKNQLVKALDGLHSYIEANDIHAVLTNGMQQWKIKIIEYIRSEYDYEYICTHALPYEKLYEVVSPADMELIVKNPDLVPSLTETHAKTIIDEMSKAIGSVLTTTEIV
jgi:DNA polymerase elongation subunit (family B)